MANVTGGGSWRTLITAEGIYLVCVQEPRWAVGKLPRQKIKQVNWQLCETGLPDPEDRDQHALVASAITGAIEEYGWSNILPTGLPVHWAGRCDQLLMGTPGGEGGLRLNLFKVHGPVYDKAQAGDLLAMVFRMCRVPRQ